MVCEGKLELHLLRISATQSWRGTVELLAMTLGAHLKTWNVIQQVAASGFFMDYAAGLLEH